MLQIKTWSCRYIIYRIVHYAKYIAATESVTIVLWITW